MQPFFMFTFNHIKVVIHTHNLRLLSYHRRFRTETLLFCILPLRTPVCKNAFVFIYLSAFLFRTSSHFPFNGKLRIKVFHQEDSPYQRNNFSVCELASNKLR